MQQQLITFNVIKMQVIMRAAQNQTVAIVKADAWLSVKTFLLNNLKLDQKNLSPCLSTL